jgi:phosphatidylserine decarboxylase
MRRHASLVHALPHCRRPQRFWYSAFVSIDRAGLPFIGLAAIPAVLALWAGFSGVAAGLLVLPLAIALFFRDPERQPACRPEEVLSPADGTVMFAGRGVPGETPPGDWQQVTIFLSPLDVHINRTPVSGRVTRVEYRPGTFRPAYHHDAHRNEQSEIWFDHDGQAIVARQVVGAMARRVVCRLTPGEVVTAGARLGLMKFGSRMDVFMPVTATLLVTARQRVRAGETVIARLGREE